MSWIKNVMVAVDRLGNAIAGGNPQATISGRVGYHSKQAHLPFLPYWRLLEMVIDFAFSPVGGPRHCQKNYQREEGLKHNHGSDFMRAILGLLVIGCCFFIAIFTRLYVVIVPKEKYAVDLEPVEEQENGYGT